MRIASFWIVGQLPGLLMHSPLGMARTDGAPELSAGKKIPTAEEEAEAGAYRLASGQLYLPATQFRSSLINGAKGRKFGKFFATALIKTSVFESGEMMECGLVDPETREPLKDYEIDVRRVVIGKSGVMRARPLLKRWACRLDVEYDEERISPEQILSVLQIAGKVSGVGDNRPSSL